jgi:hypothetical protein
MTFLFRMFLRLRLTLTDAFGDEHSTEEDVKVEDRWADI